jgi:hypothetical protein
VDDALADAVPAPLPIATTPPREPG